MSDLMATDNHCDGCGGRIPDAAGAFCGDCIPGVGRIAGIYPGIPNEDYHADTEWWGSSQLKSHIPEFYGVPSGRDALDFGSALHTRTLGTDERIDVHDFPTWRSAKAEAARAESLEAGAIPILASDSEIIDAMVQALRDHDGARRLLFDLPGQNEVSVYAEDDGQRFKCRPDRLLDSGLIVDLKSTREKPGRRNLASVVMNLGYELAAAHYTATCEAAGIDVTGFAFVFVGKPAPHHVTVVDLDEEFLADGYALRHLAINRATSGAPTYEGASGHLTLTRPFRRDIPA
jgi:hypothetical protein